MEDKITLNIFNSIKHEPCDTTFAAEFLRLSSAREITKEHTFLDGLVNISLHQEKSSLLSRTHTMLIVA